MSNGLHRLRTASGPAPRSRCVASAVLRCILISSHLLWAIALPISADAAPAGAHASRWDGDARSAIRLIAGSSPGAGTVPVRAGIEIRLKSGWHTYWRYPGDAGVPPRFDFAGSENVRSVTVRWPAPRRIPEQGLNVIGYEGGIILPLVIVPEDQSKPVTLRLKLDYAVCEKLCVPAEGQSELLLSGGPSPHDGVLRTAEAQVPKRVSPGDGSTLAVRSIRREDGQGRPRAVVDIAASRSAPIDVFAEGPTADWALPVPLPVQDAPPGLQRFEFELDGAPPGARYDGVSITLTVVSGNEAIEVIAHLD
jgi:DsbC/DsbD-like thiol-disulfide interchange protein